MIFKNIKNKCIFFIFENPQSIDLGLPIYLHFGIAGQEGKTKGFLGKSDQRELDEEYEG
jgi:hypothetical protein